MNALTRASPAAAFLTGIAVAVPVLLSVRLSADGFAFRFVVAFAWVLYLVAWIAFVHGPASFGRRGWYAFGWIPNDWFWPVFRRGMAWLVGVAASLAPLERFGAI